MILVSAAAALLAVQGGGWTAYAPSAPQAQAAQQQSASRPLAANEILLELGAMGTDSSPADLAEVSVSIKARGKNEEAARAAHGAMLTKVREAARAAGVAAADIEEGDTNVGPDMDASMTDLMEPMRPLRPGQSTQATEEPFSASSVVKLRVRTIGRLESLEDAVEKAGAETIGTPQYSAQDTAAARQGARRKAIAQARTDAETYAAALNMRVARILRVTERTGTDMMTMMLSEMSGGGEAGMFKMFEGSSDGRVPTMVFVGVDFVLAPR
jgi:uncharacterized protein YggE